MNEPASQAEMEALRESARRGAPYGHSDWTASIAQRLRLESTLRPRGRPKRVLTPF